MPDFFNPQIDGIYYSYNRYIPSFTIVPTFFVGANPNRVSLILTNANGHYVYIYIYGDVIYTDPLVTLEPGETKILKWEEIGSLVCQTFYYAYTTYTTNNNTVVNGNFTATEIIYKPTG
jgi:hypothetical protein